MFLSFNVQTLIQIQVWQKLQICPSSSSRPSLVHPFWHYITDCFVFFTRQQLVLCVFELLEPWAAFITDHEGKLQLLGCEWYLGARPVALRLRVDGPEGQVDAWAPVMVLLRHLMLVRIKETDEIHISYK